MRQFLHGIAAVERSLPKLLVVPGVFADGERDLAVVQEQEGLRLGRDEIARLVEHVVGGQQHFGLTKQNVAARQHGGAVGSALTCGRFGGADVAGDHAKRQSGGLGRQTFQLAAGSLHKRGLLDQIARRITCDRKFRENHHLRAGRGGFARGADHAVHVAGQVADSGVDLT
jgi:hypothetical protein